MVEKKINWVESKYRTNPLSQIPAPYQVVIDYQDGRASGYINIHEPAAYIEEIVATNAGYELKKFAGLPAASKIEAAKKLIASIRVTHDTDNNLGVTWNSATSSGTPWDALKTYSKRFPRLQTHDDKNWVFIEDEEEEEGGHWEIIDDTDDYY